MVDQAERLGAVGDRAELVQRAARLNPAARLGRRVHAVKGVTVITNLVLREGSGDDYVPVLVELSPLRGQVRACCARHCA